MPIKIESNSDALVAYRYSSSNQAGVATTYLQLTDEQQKALGRADQVIAKPTEVAALGSAVTDEDTAASALTQAQSILQRMRTLTLQVTGSVSTDTPDASNDPSGAAAQKIQAELDKLHDELDRITSDAQMKANDGQQQLISNAQRQASSDAAQSRAASSAEKDPAEAGTADGGSPDGKAGQTGTDQTSPNPPESAGWTAGSTGATGGLAARSTAAGSTTSDVGAAVRAGSGSAHQPGTAVTATGEARADGTDGEDEVVPLVNGSHSARQTLLYTRWLIAQQGSQALQSQTSDSTEHALALLLG